MSEKADGKNMIDGWNSKFAELVREARHRILNAGDTASNTGEKKYVLRTNGWPVEASIGGTIAITEEGHVVRADHDTDAVETIYDRNTIKLALICASEKIAEFQQLLPPKPENAFPCPQCEGQGFVTAGRNPNKLRCGRCLGLGWNPRP